VAKIDFCFSGWVRGAEIEKVTLQEYRKAIIVGRKKSTKTAVPIYL
jgi:hypothetical protein